MIGRWLYRSRQFFIALLGRVSKKEMREARQVLGPALYGIFAAMPGQHRRHAFAVYKRAREEGSDDRAVWQAALLHDSGKFDPASGRYVTIWHRVAVVLLEIATPGRRLLKALAAFGKAHGPSGLTGYVFFPFYLSERHAPLGAKRARERGASPQVVELIANHHDYKQPDTALAALQAADERS